MMRETSLTPDELLDEDSYEATIRPGSLEEYIGQVKIKDNLSVFMEAARRRGTPSTTSCFTVRQASERRPWPTLCPEKWQWISR